MSVTQHILLSIDDYTPSPFEGASWESIGDPSARSLFAPLAIAVVPSSPTANSPMFKDFAQDSTTKTDGRWHAPDPFATISKTEVAEGIVAAPSISPEALSAQLEEQYRLGHEAGVQHGIQQASSVAETRAAQLSETHQAFQAMVTGELKQFYSQIEHEAVGLALEVAKRILAVTAEVRPDYIKEVVSSAVNALGASKPHSIRVSAQDYEFIKIVGLPPELSTSALGVRYIADDNIKSGCIVDTDFGQLDLQLDTMWEQIKTRVFEVVK